MKMRYVGKSGNVPTVGKLIHDEEYDVSIFSKKILKDFKNRHLLVSVPTTKEKLT